MTMIEFKFSYLEEVGIKALGVRGTVTELCSRGHTTSENLYRVIFWAESARKDEWLHEFELEPVRDERTARIGAVTMIDAAPDSPIVRASQDAVVFIPAEPKNP